jgi:hypothetical protein
MSLNVTTSFPTPVSQSFSYPDPITQLWQGNPIAYIAGALLIIVVALSVAVFIVKLKMPQLAWALFKNNLRGGGPITASIFENNVVKFYLPKLFQSGVAYDGEWSVYAKAYAKSDEEISAAERDLLMSACNIVNAPGQLYFNYAIQCQVVNPKLLAMMQHEETMQKIKPGYRFKIPKARIIQVLNAMGEDEVEFKTFNLCLPVQLKGIKQVLPKSLRKYDLKAIENLVRDWMKGQGMGANWAMIACILVGIGIAVTVILHFV